MRDAEIKDASFILSLRLDTRKSRYLNPTNNDLKEQEAYLQKYKEEKQDEFYFIIEGYDRTPYGTVRIYDVGKDSFCPGSWLTSYTAPLSAGLEGMLLALDYGFSRLKLPLAKYDVRSENKSVIRFHKRLGAVIVREDEQNVYFQLSKESFDDHKSYFEEMISSNVSANNP
ncbi:MAG: GNAT family N-acetyltransferase [Planctomycetia bacterium]|nr:GNAT family N-acetyltransferase [Planctomycetia bacterium]